jgi:cysteine desulfurase / selenocysteine lyase
MIYFDNAATTFPKPKIVVKQMTYMMNNYAANPGRGGHRLSRMAGEMVKETRENLSDFFGIYESKRLIFTFNDTLAINMAIHGTLKPGDHVITTSYEHNAITRPLTKLSKCGVEVTILDGNLKGEISFDELVKSIRPNTKIVAASFSSNVIGNIMPIAEIGKICRENNILFLVDAAQGAGLIKIDVEKMYIDLLAVPGHKSLYGPMGTGLLYIGERADVEDIFQGGTGTVSEDLEQPHSFPERYESGTSNAVGICGLNAGVNFIRKKGMDTIRKHEEKLANIILDGLSEIKGVKILGEDMKERLPVVAFNIRDVRSLKVSAMLDKKYDIATRGGLHCAGLFHKLAGTIKQGAVRVSPGFFNTKEEAFRFVKAVRNVARELGE